MRAMAALDRSLDEFTALLDAKDKQEIPIKQQEALGYVGIMEEAMVKGFPYTVPAQYANLPQLKARARGPCSSASLLRPPACLPLVHLASAPHCLLCSGLFQRWRLNQHAVVGRGRASSRAHGWVCGSALEGGSQGADAGE